MSRFPECHGIIPARYESSRFPGKPLSEIMGKPMFWHVYDRARQCPQMSTVTLATDDDRIFEAARQHEVPVVMTSNSHRSGTDRVLEAARKLDIDPEAVVVNIQGDEPCLEPDMLTELLTPFESSKVHVTTLATAIGREEAESPDRVKVVRAQNGRALYFSRSMIPFDRDEKSTVSCFTSVFTPSAWRRWNDSGCWSRVRLSSVKSLSNSVCWKTVLIFT